MHRGVLKEIHKSSENGYIYIYKNKEKKLVERRDKYRPKNCEQNCELTPQKCDFPLWKA
jgi:hypothetical protein